MIFTYFEVFAWVTEDELFGDIITNGRVYTIERLSVVILPITVSDVSICSSWCGVSDSCRRHDASSFVGSLRLSILQFETTFLK
jgi:hypothetical protein